MPDLQLFHVLKYTITGNKYKFAQIVQETASIQNQYSGLQMVVVTMSTNSRLMRLTSELSPHFWQLVSRNMASSGVKVQRWVVSRMTITTTISKPLYQLSYAMLKMLATLHNLWNRDYQPLQRDMGLREGGVGEGEGNEEGKSKRWFLFTRTLIMQIHIHSIYTSTIDTTQQGLETPSIHVR